MKKKLLKVPENNGQILLLPEIRKLIFQIKGQTSVATAHQPYFFHPGIALKFLFLQHLPAAKKRIIFLDTDKTRLEVKVPGPNFLNIVSLIDSDYTLDQWPTPEEEVFQRFFSEIKASLKKSNFPQKDLALTNLSRFTGLFLQNTNQRLLKYVLALSFMQFYGIKQEFSFLSELLEGREFREFFRKIYNENSKFQKIFNTALDEYKSEFKFRFKNYPFPRLEDAELPFWLVREGRRLRCFKQDIQPRQVNRIKIFPRAVTLTLFLRLYKSDVFIHGIGGANYEWVQDRLIERFFQQKVPGYAVLSGTFLIDGFSERDFPYFLFSAKSIKEKLYSFIKRTYEFD